jgi:hypothetical protein
MEEANLSKEESLKLVTAMISQAKNAYYENGLGFLLWGFTNLLCFGLSYIAVTYTRFVLPFNPFYLMIITFALHVYFAKRERKYQKVKTFTDEANEYAWIAFGISMLILTIAGAYANMGYLVLPVLLLLFGVPTFITGCVNKFRPLIWGAIICWILSIVSFVHKGNYALLLVAAGATAAWIIPGFILRSKFMKNLHV